MELKQIIGGALRLARVSVVSAALALLPVATTSAAGSFAITGTVTDTNGVGVTGVAITADTPSATTVDFGPVTTAADGTYTLHVDAGTYDFHFDPPGSSGLSAMDDSYVTVTGDQTLDMQLRAAVSGQHSISGTISDQNGNMLATYSPAGYSTNAI